MTGWRVLWYRLWPDEEPDEKVAASLDEIAAVCAPFGDDPFLVIALYQHRHGQVLKTSVGEWLETHGGTLRDHFHGAAAAASKLEAATGRAIQATAALDALGGQVAARLRQSLAGVERADRALREQTRENAGVWRDIREHLSWIRPTLLVLLVMALLASLMLSAFLGKQAFAERPGQALWARLSDDERRDLPDFIASGALDTVMHCQLMGFRIKEGRCLPSPDLPSPEHRSHAEAGWTVPAQVAARAAHRWSAERQ